MPTVQALYASLFACVGFSKNNKGNFECQAVEIETLNTFPAGKIIIDRGSSVYNQQGMPDVF